MDDFTPATGIDWQGPDVGMVRYGVDKQLVIFYNKSVPNPIKAKETGRPYNEDKVFVRIQQPGERFTVIDRPVTSDDTRRWPMQWAQFRQNQEQTVSGTPIDLLFPTQPSIAANLRANGVQTVEQCAELSGSAIDSVGMGAQQWSNEAKSYLEAAQKGVHYTHMKQELDKRDGDIRVLTQQVEQLKAQLNQLIPREGQTAQAGGFSPAQLYQMLSGLMQNPQMPPPGVEPTQVFDAQTAQIAATHPSRDEAVARKRGRPRKTP